MSCQCESCKAHDTEKLEKLYSLGKWLQRRLEEGKNVNTTTSMLIRKLKKIGIEL